jgi:threonine dehydratase
MTVVYSDILAARKRISPHLETTPLVHSATLSAAAGGDVRLKLESLQTTGSFKTRGALNALMLTPRSELVITASAGNHGRAVAWAAERLGMRALVFTPRSAPRVKTEPILAHGAELRAETRDYEEAERRAKQYASEHDATFVSPYDHPHVIAGAGTIALELLEQDPDIDTIVVPIGGGGLISGIALAAKSVRPSIRVIGVEAEASAAFSAALAAGRIVEIAVGPTIADGLGGNVDPQTMTWPMIRDRVDEVVSVPERWILDAIRHLVHVEDVKAEGAGATASAAVLSGRLDLKGRNVAVLVSGQNIDESRLMEIL